MPQPKLASGVVYIVLNPRGFVYVGKRHSLSLGDYFGSGVVISRSLERYGREAHSRAVLARCGTTEALNRAERKWIRFYRRKLGIKRVLNIADGGEGLSPKVAASLYDRPGYREKASKTAVLTLSDPKVRAKISKGVRARCDDSDWLARRTAAQTASWNSADRREKNAETVRQRWADPEYRARLSAIHKERNSIRNIPVRDREHGPDGRFLPIGGRRVEDENVE